MASFTDHRRKRRKLAIIMSMGRGGGRPRISFSGSIAEGATTGRAVGTATLANPPIDIGTLTWSELGTGTGAALFAIDGSTGAVTNTAEIDYDVATGGATSYTYGIQVTDGVYTYELMATISVLVVLTDLSLSNATWIPGTPTSGLILGARDASEVITLGAGWPTGFSINSAARTWAHDGSGTDASGTGELIGTHPQATNSPHTTSLIAWEVTSGPVLHLSGSWALAEDSPVSTVVGTLAVVGHPSGSSGWTFTITADPENKFALS